MAIERLHDDYMEFVEQIDGGGEAGFVINDDSRAEWAVKKIRQAHKRIADAEDFVQAEMDKLNAWLEQVKSEQQRTIDYMTGLLRPYFEHLRESGTLGRKKSYTLPSGVLQVRASQPKLQRDDDKLIAWAKATDETLIKTEEKPVWSEIKKRLNIVGEGFNAVIVDKETGAVVDGVTIAELAGETFSVKVEVF